MILDSKLTWKPHLDHKCNKAIAAFRQCHRIVGKTWGITPHIAHWLYTAIVRPMLVYAAVVWWPRVELGTARTMLERIQRLACLAIAGSIRTTPTAAMEILLGLPPLDLYIKNVAMTSCYRLKTFGHWVQGSVPKGHMQITTAMAREAPTTMMKSDKMVLTYSFDHCFKVSIPNKKAWLNSEKLPLPSCSSAVYIDGSCSTG